MILWTIQSLEAWHILQEEGVLRAEPQSCEPAFADAYQWLIARAEEKIGRPSACRALLWGWYQWSDARHRMPDLRFSGHNMSGARSVRLQIEIDESECLLSDFGLWHYALNYWFLPFTEAEGDSFEAELTKEGLSFYKTSPLPHMGYDRKIRDSWERIFDLDWAEPSITRPKDQKAIQAVFWELRIGQVKKVKEFVSR